MGSATSSVKWTHIIRPGSSLLDFRLRELWSYRDLVVLLVRRDFVARYKQTILGPVWHVITPLFSSVVYTIVFGSFAGMPTDGVPPFLFYLAGSVAWGYFERCITGTSNVFVSNAHIFGKVYFPRIAVPVAMIFSNLIAFAIHFLIFTIVLALVWFQGGAIHPNTWIVFTPLLLLLMAGMGLGAGVLISSITTRYRDLMQLVGFGVLLLMYVTPVIYPLSMVPERFQWAVLANPLTPIFETFRFAFLGVGTVAPIHLAYSTAAAVSLLLGGIVLFNRVERTFVDTV